MHYLNRRRVVQVALACAGFPWAVRSQAEELIATDPQAITLGYVADAAKVDVKKNPTYKPGQRCANCLLLTGKEGDAFRPCNVFPGKLVAATGWCRSWVKKA